MVQELPATRIAELFVTSALCSFTAIDSFDSLEIECENRDSQGNQLQITLKFKASGNLITFLKVFIPDQTSILELQRRRGGLLVFASVCKLCHPNQFSLLYHFGFSHTNFDNIFIKFLDNTLKKMV